MVVGVPVVLCRRHTSLGTLNSPRVICLRRPLQQKVAPSEQSMSSRTVYFAWIFSGWIIGFLRNEMRWGTGPCAGEKRKKKRICGIEQRKSDLIPFWRNETRHLCKGMGNCRNRRHGGRVEAEAEQDKPREAPRTLKSPSARNRESVNPRERKKERKKEIDQKSRMAWGRKKDGLRRRRNWPEPYYRVHIYIQ